MSRNPLPLTARLIMALVLLAAPAFAQLSFVHDQRFGVNPFGNQGNGPPTPVFIPYGQARVCSAVDTPSISPCPDLAAIFSLTGVPLTVTGGNFGQITTDNVGQFNFACNGGSYFIQVAAVSSNTPQSQYYTTCPSLSAGGLLSSANTWTGINTFTQNVVFSGLSPWVDVTSSTYGAKCDGSTDDTTAFQNAINAAASGNVNASLVYVPVGTAGMCIVAGQLNADATSNVAIVGGSNQNWGNGTLKPAIRFTGSTAPLISAKSSVGFSIINMTIQYSNGAFSGNVVDISHGVSGIDSSGTIFQNNDFTGLGGIAVSAACLISGDKANSVQVFHNTFNFAVTPICGAASGGSYANGWFIWNNEFGAASGTLSGTYIKGMKDGATVVGNVAENPTGNLMDNSTVPCTGCVIQFDVEDEAAGYSGTYFNGNFSGSTFAGGFYQGGSSALGTFLNMPSGSSGISVKGASLRNLAVAFVFNSSNQTNIDFTGNQYSAITSFSTNFPASGVWDDNTGAKRYFGLVQFPGNTITTNGTVVNSGTCQSQPPITLTGVAGTGSKVAWALSGVPPATWQTGITVLPAVTANTVTLWLCNPTAGNITPAAQVVNVNVTQ